MRRRPSAKGRQEVEGLLTRLMQLGRWKAVHTIDHQLLITLGLDLLEDADRVDHCLVRAQSALKTPLMVRLAEAAKLREASCEVGEHRARRRQRVGRCECLQTHHDALEDPNGTCNRAAVRKLLALIRRAVDRRSRDFRRCVRVDGARERVDLIVKTARTPCDGMLDNND